MELPRRLPRKASPGDPRIGRYLTDALTAAVTAFEEQARARCAEAAAGWAARLEDQADRQLTVAAEWFRHCVRTPPDEDDLSALDDLTARLGALRSALATPASPGEETAAQVTAGGEAPRAGRGGCTVCAQLEETLTGQLRRRQFLLATRDADRARLTRAGGYCPVHTWQYASLSPGSAGCALCQALANRERDAVTEAAAQAPDSPLCLQHLAMALTAGPRPQRDGP